MIYIIFDLEATCEDRAINPNWDNEVIEIGAVKLNEKGETLGEFTVFVKPKEIIQLTDFCKNLTKITQKDVDNGKIFPLAFSEFISWASLETDDIVFCSWGYYDKHQIKKDCTRYQMSTPIDESNHINIKEQHAQLLKLKKGVGMEKALRLENLKLDGTHHRGIDDARNIAKIFVKHLGKWKIQN